MTTPQQVHIYYPPKPPSNGLAVAGMILGIIALATALIPIAGWFLAALPALLAIIFGHIGHATANRNQVGKGAAVTAWVTGYLALIVVPFVSLVLIGVINAGSR